ncbi:MAG: glycosyltransferase family 4 protein [Nakamurella sp.]
MIESAATKADALVVPAHAVAVELSSQISVRVPMTAVGWGVGGKLTAPVDALERRRRLGLPGKYMTFVGTVEPRKGLDVLIGALAKANVPIPVVLVGPKGWGGIDLQRLIGDAGLPTEQVLPLGVLDDADLSAVVAGALALVAPSRSEGFGLPVLEAMSMGVPVVISEVPALVELSAGAGLSVPVDNHEALAEALVRVATDTDLRERLAVAGLARASDYSWASAADKVWQIVTA